MTRFAPIAICAALLTLACAPTTFAAGPPPATVQPIAGDVFTGETATANETAASRASCAAPVLSSPLAALGDARSYFLAPGADFEARTLDGWKLSGGAAVVSGNATQRVLGLRHAQSLRLAPGASATSPIFCIDLNYPTFRFFVAQLQARADAGLEVDVIYPDLATKNVRRAATVNASGGTQWTLAKDVALKPKSAGKEAGWRRVALRFRVPTGKAGADWRIDDVLVDPRCRF